MKLITDSVAADLTGDWLAIAPGFAIDGLEVEAPDGSYTADNVQVEITGKEDPAASFVGTNVLNFTANETGLRTLDVVARNVRAIIVNNTSGNKITVRAITKPA